MGNFASENRKRRHYEWPFFENISSLKLKKRKLLYSSAEKIKSRIEINQKHLMVEINGDF